jgi:hypothetical protein
VHRWAATLLCLLAAPALAATAVETSVEALAREAGAVVRGRVEARAARRSGDGRRIVTDLTVSVAQAWRGSAPARLTVTVPGGELDGVGQRVDAAPALEPGDEVVLFVSPTPGGWRLAGLALGAFHVEGARVRSAAEAFRVEPAPLASGERRVEAMGLDELERRVRGAR